MEMKPYLPAMLPLKHVAWEKFISLVGQANYQLALFEGILKGIANPSVFLAPLTSREAVISSRIEGTVVTLEELYKYEVTQQASEARIEDIKEVANYRRSLQFAVEWLEKKPITLNLLRRLHETLLGGVRGQNKALGEFRRIQNYIGQKGTGEEGVTYVPPAPEHVSELLSNFEKYIHTDERDPLVQLAIIHAQFELIHPFLDGNGRIGRILVPLFLFSKGLLSSPVFYISAHLDANRDTYIDRLAAISHDGDWDSWISFFLRALIEQAKENADKAQKVLLLYEQMKERVVKATGSRHSMRVLDAMFNRPVFDTSTFVAESKIPRRSAIRVIGALEENELVYVLRSGKGRRSSLMFFWELLKIVD